MKNENWRVIDLQTNSAAMAQFRLCTAKQYIGISFHSIPSTQEMVIA